MVGWKVHLERAIYILGSQPKLARAMDCSQSKISWLLLTAKKIPAEDALAVHRATDGLVNASQLRPDLWASPQYVPQQQMLPARSTSAPPE